jgi:peptidoglycan hydrolase CwlO-like protein
MFRASTRRKTRDKPYYHGTNYVSTNLYQYTEGLQILDQMPQFIPKEEITNIVTYFQSQIDNLKQQVTIIQNISLDDDIVDITSAVNQNTEKIRITQDNLELLESYIYSNTKNDLK